MSAGKTKPFVGDFRPSQVTSAIVGNIVQGNAFWA